MARVPLVVSAVDVLAPDRQHLAQVLDPAHLETARRFLRIVGGQAADQAVLTAAELKPMKHDEATAPGAEGEQVCLQQTPTFTFGVKDLHLYQFRWNQNMAGITADGIGHGLRSILKRWKPLGGSSLRRSGMCRVVLHGPTSLRPRPAAVD